MTSVNDPEDDEQEMTDSKPQCNKTRTFVDHLHEVSIIYISPAVHIFSCGVTSDSSLSW